MTAVKVRASGGAIFSNLVIVLLLALAVGLYLQLVIVEQGATDAVPIAAASVRVVEQAADAAGQRLVPLPEDQVLLIKQVFAPELL